MQKGGGGLKNKKIILLLNRIDDMKFLDAKVPYSEVNLKYTTVFSQSMKTARDPTNCIVRYQMMELIARLAG